MKNLKHLQRFKGNIHKKQGGWWEIAAMILSTAISYEQGQVASSQAEEQSKASQRATQAQERAANVKAQQERVKVQREARIARAQVISGATSTGLSPSGTSGAAGAVSSISSQAGANIGAINQAQSFAKEASIASQQAATLGGDIAKTGATAAQWQTIGGLAKTVFSDTGGFKTIFGDKIKKAGQP